MTQKQDPQTKKVKKKTNKKRDWSFYAIITCLILIAIPTLILGITIIRATGDRGKPVIGARFDGDLDPKLDISTLGPVKETIGGWEGVQSVDIDLKTATVRINILVSPETSKDSMKSHASGARDALYGAYPEKEYFLATDSKTMYDIEINVYNYANPTDEQAESFVYYQLTKTSNSESIHESFLTDTRSPEFVQSLIEAENAEDEVKEPAEPETNEEAADDSEE